MVFIFKGEPLIVCLCMAVSDRDLIQEIEAGATTARELIERTGAATDCGQCGCEVKQILRSARSELDEPEPVPMPLMGFQPA